MMQLFYISVLCIVFMLNEARIGEQSLTLIEKQSFMLDKNV